MNEALWTSPLRPRCGVCRANGGGCPTPWTCLEIFKQRCGADDGPKPPLVIYDGLPRGAADLDAVAKDINRYPGQWFTADAVRDKRIDRAATLAVVLIVVAVVTWLALR